MTKKKPHVVIPAAGLGTRMLPTSARIPKAMIPLQEKPIISWILDELIGQGFTDFTIIYGHLGHFLTDYVERYYAVRDGLNISFTEQTQLDGVATAIALAEEHVHSDGMLVVLGDTVFQQELELPDDKSFIMYSKVNDTWRWCLIEVDGSQKVIGYLDKPDEPVDTDKALVGVYYMHDAKRFFDGVRHLRDNDIRIKNEFQISSALEYYEQEHPVFGYEIERWYDCGSKDTYQQSKKSMLVAPREFNELKIEDNTVTKRSQHKKKFLDEILWFVSIPKKLRSHIPTVIDHNLDPEDPFITLEYVPYPTLSELFLYENIRLDMWKKMFANLTDTYMQQFTSVKNFESEDWQGEYRRHYLEKTFERIDEVKNITEFCELFSYSKLVINGEECVPYRDLFKKVADVMFPRIAKEEDLCLIHGDLCFSNVLYDVDTEDFKLIDPRGSFGRMKLYGDYKYDLAKLYHSAVGLYDFITHDLFTVAQNDAQLDLTIYANEDHRKIGELLKQQLTDKHVDLDVLEFITSLLFYSMLPLHQDHPNRMKAFFCIATQILNRLAARVLDDEQRAAEPRREPAVALFAGGRLPW
jgi:dTDP-glucose pyrophosphorylase